MLKITLILLFLVFALNGITFAVQRAVDKQNWQPPCKKDDCDECPFPPCNEKDRKRHIGE